MFRSIRARWLSSRAGRLLGQERWEDAAVLYEQCVRLNPELADAHANLGGAYFKLGRCEEAVPCYRTSLALNADSYDSWVNLAGALWKLERVDQAADAYRAAADLDATAAEPLRNWANILIRQERDAEALVVQRRLAGLDPDNAGLRLLIGNTLDRLGRWDDAAHEYEEALSLLERQGLMALEGQEELWAKVEAVFDDTMERSLRTCGFLSWHAHALLKLNQLEAAKELLERSNSMNPDHGPTLELTGVVCTRMGRPQEAADAFRRALELGAQMALTTYYDDVGWAEAKSGNTDAAIAALVRGIIHNPNQTKPYVRLGTVLEEAGRLDDARIVYEQILAKGIGDEETHRRLSALEALPNPPGGTWENP